MATQSTFLAYVFTKTSHMNHRLSKGLVYTRTHSSLPALHSPYQPVHYNHSCAWVLTPYSSTLSYTYVFTYTYTLSRIIFTHSCNKTTNIQHYYEYVTILLIYNNNTNIYIDVTIIQCQQPDLQQPEVKQWFPNCQC